MDLKKTIIIILLVDLAIVGILFLVFAKMAIPVEEREILGIRSLFPQGPPINLESNGWQGLKLPHRFRLLYRDYHDDYELWPMVEKGVNHIKIAKRVKIGDEGWYVISKRNKGYLMTTVFLLDKRIFWLDMGSSSSLDQVKKTFDTCLVNMKINRREIAPTLEGELSSINSEISPFFIQQPIQLIGMIAGILVIIIVIVSIVFKVAGSCPANIESGVLIATPGVGVRIRSFGSSNSCCCLTLSGHEIIAYRFKKPFLRLDLKQEKKNLSWHKNRLRYGKYSFYLPAREVENWRNFLSLQ